MADEIKYRREEGGFTVIVNGQPTATFRIKNWMDGLHHIPDFRPGIFPPGYRHKRSSFADTQADYYGFYEP